MGLVIKETNKGFEIKTVPYNEKEKNAIKSIKNAYYRSKDFTWVVPRYMENSVDALKREFGIKETFDPVLSMPEQVGILDPLPDLEMDIDLVRPLFEFQKPAVAQAIIWKRIIIGDEMGLAKTASAIATSIALKCKCILVVCPNNAKYNWQNEWSLTAGRRSIILCDGTSQKWPRYYETGMCNVFIVNYESLKKFFVKSGWKRDGNQLKNIPFRDGVNIFDCVIVDESHYLSNDTLMSLLTRAISDKAPVRILLTGTLLSNKVNDIANQLACIGRLNEIVSHIPQPLDQYGRKTDFEGFTRFYNRYCDGGSGESNLNELKYRLRKICYLRRQKSEVLNDLPDKIRKVVYCDLSNMTEYKSVQAEFVKYLKDIKASDNPNKRNLLAGQMLKRMTKLRQLAAMGKIEAAKEYVSDVIREGKKIVIFAHHLSVIDELIKAFPDAVTLTGYDTNEQRFAAIKKFQNDPKANKIICSIKVAAEAVNLTAASDVLAVETPYTDTRLEQMIARCHRIGQKDSVLAGILTGRKCIDVYVYFDIVLKKKELFEKVAENDTITISEADELVDGLLNFFTNTSNEAA